MVIMNGSTAYLDFFLNIPKKKPMPTMATERPTVSQNMNTCL